MKVSIITPAKNSARYVESCIQSVLRQASHEHIFMDGGSTDGTLGIIKNYTVEYPGKIKLFEGKDKSAGDAWVKGMRLATGDILGFLGADDTLVPYAIDLVLKYFQHNPLTYFVFGGVNYIDEAGTILKTPKLKDFGLNDAVNNYCSIPATSAFYRREIIKTVPPDVIALNDGELEWWLQIGQKYQLYRIPHVLSNFRVYPEKQRPNSFYEYARTVYGINRKYGAGRFSKCAVRYYASVVSRPFSPILTPVFNWLVYYKSSGQRDITERK